jgi:hypothetical protein
VTAPIELRKQFDRQANSEAFALKANCCVAAKCRDGPSADIAAATKDEALELAIEQFKISDPPKDNLVAVRVLDGR